MTDPITINTPSGHKVVFKPFLTFGAKRELERIWLRGSRVDPKHPEKMDFDASTLYDAQDAALKLMVASIELPDGPLVDEPQAILDYVSAMTPEDGQAIYDRLNQLTGTNVPEDQKKGA